MTEPSVLPSRVPNLLINGSAGIAVGMATNIPPHNLTEVISGLVYLIDHPEATVEDLMRLIPGPDFPSAGFILGEDGIKSAYQTGRGTIIMQGKAEIEHTDSGRNHILITELPFQVNKARMVERIAELIREKKLDGISDLRDESDRNGIRVVLELRRDANPNVILNRLYKHTQLQESFGVNMLALVDGTPADAEFERDAVALPGPPGGGGDPAHPVPVEEGHGAAAHRGRPVHRPAPPGRGDRPDPPLPGRGRGPAGADAELRPERTAGPGDPGSCGCTG